MHLFSSTLYGGNCKTFYFLNLFYYIIYFNKKQTHVKISLGCFNFDLIFTRWFVIFQFNSLRFRFDVCGCFPWNVMIFEHVFLHGYFISKGYRTLRTLVWLKVNDTFYDKKFQNLRIIFLPFLSYVTSYALASRYIL